MQEKIIEVPYHREYFIASQKIAWEISYKKPLKSNIVYTALAVAVITMGFFEEKSDFSLSFIAGGGFLFYMILAWSGFFERRSKLFKQINQLANTYDKEKMISTYIFSDYGIEYKDKEKQYRLSWHLFNPFTTFQDHILLHLKSNHSLVFVIGKKEIGEQNYKDAYEILMEKGNDAAIAD